MVAVYHYFIVEQQTTKPDAVIYKLKQSSIIIILQVIFVDNHFCRLESWSQQKWFIGEGCKSGFNNLVNRVGVVGDGCAGFPSTPLMLDSILSMEGSYWHPKLCQHPELLLSLFLQIYVDLIWLLSIFEKLHKS